VISKWTSVKVGDITEVVTRGISPAYDDNGKVEVINQRCIRGGIVLSEFARRHDSEKKTVPEQKCIKKNDILINSTGVGTVGRSAVVSGDVSIGEKTVDSHVTIVRSLTNLVDPNFLHMAFVAFEPLLISRAQGSGGQVELSRAEISNLEIPLPPLDEQKRIVAKLDEALGDLDQVATNSKIALDQVDFLWTAFLVESFHPREYSVGADLDSWQEREFSDVIDVYQPVTISTKQLVPDGPYLVYGANGVIGRYSDFNHQESELLMTCRGATCGALTISEPKSWINGNAMVVRPKQSDLDKEFIFYALLGGVDIDSAITGTAQPQITRTSLAKILIKYPPLSKQKNIVAKLDDLKQQIEAMQKAKQDKIEQASSLRSSILSAAFAGDF
jgi:type I restriction enzyme S subunit